MLFLLINNIFFDIIFSIFLNIYMKGCIILQKINYINKDFLKKCAKKTLKVTRNTLIGIATISAVTIGGYSAYIHNSLKKIEIDQEAVNSIVKKYEDEEITFICLNDSQAININPCFWEPNAIEYIENSLVEQGANVQFINASSLKFNKTNHIDKMLDSNLSYEEIKNLNLLGAKAAFSKISSDFHIPIDCGFIGSVFAEPVKEGDDSLYISSTIQNSNNPIILYTCGGNDLMRALNNNPLSIKKYDKKGNITDNYLYSVYKANQEATLDNILINVENNFKNIYEINPSSQIYALSFYIPNNINGEDMEPFVKIINDYNKRFEELCNKYNVHYISTTDLAKVYIETANFHISEKGHKILANLLINEIAKNDFNFVEMDYQKNSDIKNKGLSEFANSLNEDIALVPYEDYDELNSTYLYEVQQTIKGEFAEERDLANQAKELTKKYQY